MTAGAFSLVLNDALVKIVADHVPPTEIIAIRSVFIAVLCALDLMARHERPRYLFDRDALIRTAFAVANTFVFVAAVTSLPFSVAVLVDYSSLLFVGIIAPFVLKEQTRLARVVATVVGLLGCYLILAPEFPSFGFLILLPLLSAMTGAGRDVWTRRFTAPGSSALHLTFHVALGLSIASLLVPDKSEWIIPSAGNFGICLAAGAFQAGAFLLTARAYFAAEATMVAPFRLTAVIWTLLISILWFAEHPSIDQFAGIALIVGALFWTVKGK